MGVTIANVIETVAGKTISKNQRKALFQARRDLEGIARYENPRRDTHIAASNRLREVAVGLVSDGFDVPHGYTALTDCITGRSTVKSARSLAETIGFGIFPWGLISGRYSPDSDTVDTLNAWYEKAKANVYVMAPVDAYDLKKHISKPPCSDAMFIPSDVRQAFMALRMSVPVFRSLQQQIDSLRDHVRDARERLQAVERDVRELGERVSALAVEVAHARAEQAKAEQQRAVAIEKWYASIADPIALILPNRATIETEDANVLVGPVWGGDLPAELAKLVAATARKRGAKPWRSVAPKV